MTREELDRLAELLAKATPGPWQPSCYLGLGGHAIDAVGPAGARLAHVADCFTVRAGHDATLIAALYNAAPALLAAAREAEELREWQREAADWMRGELELTDSRPTERFLRELLARVKP